MKTPLRLEIQYVSLFERQTDGVEMRLDAAASGYCDDERRLAATIVFPPARSCCCCCFTDGKDTNRLRQLELSPSFVLSHVPPSWENEHRFECRWNSVALVVEVDHKDRLVP